MQMETETPLDEKGQQGASNRWSTSQCSTANKVTISIATVAVLGGIAGIIYVTTRQQNQTICQRAKAGGDVKMDLIDLSYCKVLECDFDVSQCSFPCPVGYHGENFCPTSCLCSKSGVYGGDMQFNADMLPRLLKQYGMLQDGEGDLSLFSSVAEKRPVDWWNEKKTDGRYQIPYVISDSIPEFLTEDILKAVDAYSESTCIDFVPWKDQDFNFVFEDGPICSSLVGKHNSGQKVNLHPDCGSLGSIEHVLMHILGFGHEHSHPDRDDYITVLWENIRERMENNFLKYDKDEVYDLGEPYNVKSLMHFNSFVYGKDSLTATILMKDTGRPINIVRDGLALSDIRQIKELFKCPGGGAPTSISEIENGENNSSVTEPGPSETTTFSSTTVQPVTTSSMTSTAADGVGQTLTTTGSNQIETTSGVGPDVTTSNSNQVETTAPGGQGVTSNETVVTTTDSDSNMLSTIGTTTTPLKSSASTTESASALLPIGCNEQNPKSVSSGSEEWVTGKDSDLNTRTNDTTKFDKMTENSFVGGESKKAFGNAPSCPQPESTGISQENKGEGWTSGGSGIGGGGSGGTGGGGSGGTGGGGSGGTGGGGSGGTGGGSGGTGGGGSGGTDGGGSGGTDGGGSGGTGGGGSGGTGGGGSGGTDGGGSGGTDGGGSGGTGGGSGGSGGTEGGGSGGTDGGSGGTGGGGSGGTDGGSGGTGGGGNGGTGGGGSGGTDGGGSGSSGNKTSNTTSQWSSWLSWSSCSRTCGTGQQMKRLRYCNIGTKQEHCFGKYYQVALCPSKDPCPAPNVQWGPWGEFGICSKSCGKGLELRKRVCPEQDMCEPGGDFQTGARYCNTDLCSDLTNTKWSEWSAFNLCTVSCNGGIQYRIRSCMENGERLASGCEGGKAERRPCNTEQCGKLPGDGDGGPDNSTREQSKTNTIFRKRRTLMRKPCWIFTNVRQWVPGYYNGDNRVDVLCGPESDDKDWNLRYSVGKRGIAKDVISMKECGSQLKASGDFDGDGLDDVLCHSRRKINVIQKIHPPNDMNTTIFTTRLPYAKEYCWKSDETLIVLDANGDNKADLLCKYPGTENYDIKIKT